MSNIKEFKPIDFLTVTRAGNIVVTDPVTGSEFLCYRKDDSTYISTINKKELTLEDMCKTILVRLEEAKKIDEQLEAKATEQKAAKKGAATKAPKFCMNCGKPLKPGDKFCMECGNPV